MTIPESSGDIQWEMNFSNLLSNTIVIFGFYDGRTALMKRKPRQIIFADFVTLTEILLEEYNKQGRV